MLTPVARQHTRFPLRRAPALALLVPVIWSFLLATPAVATSRTASGSSSEGAVPTPADTALDASMLAAPLPGLVDFALVGPGATNGVLTAQTMASYSDDPTQVEQLFNQYSAESGFAGWIKTWQDHTGIDRVVEIGIRFHDAAEASTNASAFVTTLSKGSPNGTRSAVPSIPGASAFTINEPATTAGTTSIPAQQVQAVVYSDSDYLIVLHIDSASGTGSHPIADGTAVALALQQYQDLAASVTQPGHVTNPTKPKTGKGAGSTTRTVGFVMLGVVVLIVAAFALITWRRRRTTTPEGAATKPLFESTPEPTRVMTGIGGDTPERTPVERDAPRRRSQVRTASGQHSPKSDPRRRAPTRRRVRTPARPASQGPDGDRLVGVAALSGRASRSERLESSRTKHPSAATVLAHARPKQTDAGWYEDPSDSEHRRIRYWDGTTWTAHVAEPEA